VDGSRILIILNGSSKCTMATPRYSQIKDELRTFYNYTIKFHVLFNVGNFHNKRETVSFPRGTAPCTLFDVCLVNE
jgi:glutathione peroxidase-family protein